MAETIEDFVAKLQAEGVQAGRKAAEQRLAQAEQEARQIIAQARNEAEGIISAAKKEAENTLSRARTELQLAARDATMRLRQTLNKALEAILAQKVGEKLADTDFLCSVLQDLVRLYAEADTQRQQTIQINIAPETRQKLERWVLAELKKAASGDHVSIDLKSTLAQAGFEYNVSGATVEVTVDSVVQTLSELVGPGLRKVLDQAVAQNKD